ncbi:hypothetical protein RO3G_12367 [Rhizopus delemar RA 99-880]|uniref:Uncharacterized protein n=1 Tax=Rhizopus delemar (strain RA 99-880 / ATCC MYA-4621 / FGSC 9543 / NRRL 43880) TaxID=246409 RepID=I1CGS6_RHIO9|nr:hypothetical protein RO3G_12367 [Rhizopus delemar RA 99-880]|eukprot:EIE87656.1 hypothetical protein RO3G_12367 [Rhizopus delemar RA 99-880]
MFVSFIEQTNNMMLRDITCSMFVDSDFCPGCGIDVSQFTHDDSCPYVNQSRNS